LKTQLYIAKEIGYLDGAEFFKLNQKVEKISGMLGNLIKSIKRIK
jgi:four helix bundle protein